MEPAHSMGQESNPFHVMLIEDDLAHAKMIRRALRSAISGIKLYHFTDGHAALDFIFGRDSASAEGQPVRPHLVLLDLRLPQMGGFDVLTALKTEPSMRRIPICIVSTSDRPEDVRRSYDLGANAYVAKSMDFAEFSRDIQSVATFWLGTARLPDYTAH